LAGLAPGVELHADGVASTGETATTSVTEAGRLLRSGDATIRRLIRTRVLEPSHAPDAEAVDAEVDRAGVPPRTRRRPGE
jgi:hypothetical protein